MNFYKIENDNAILGAGEILPDGFIEYDVANVPSELEPYLTKIANEFNNAEKQANFNKAWEALKIGYNPTTQEAFQIKYGSELGESYTSTIIYNCDTLTEVNSTDYLFKMNKENVDILTAKKVSESVSVTDDEEDIWEGRLGSFPLNSITLGMVLFKANKVVKQLSKEILGA